MKNNNFVLFSGGTGGHVIPAVNFGNYIIDQGYNCTLFLDKRGLKYSKKFKGNIIKINSGHLSGNFFFKLNSIFLLILGFIKSFYFLLIIKPSFCIAFGSYASFMPLAAASILKIFNITKIYLHEQNSVVGKVNLFFLFFAKNIFLNFSDVKNLKLPQRKKIFHVGLPSNEKINFFRRKAILKTRKKIKIFVYGGSQGSLNLNKSFINIINKLPDSYCNKLSIVIQSSVKLTSEITPKFTQLNIDFKSKSFFEDIHEMLESSDLVIARAGAGTINDIIKSQIPSILVPLPNSIYNHQYFNARYLVDKNAAKLIEEKNLYSEDTFTEFMELLDNIDKRAILSKNLQTIKILDTNTLMIKKILE